MGRSDAVVWQLLQSLLLLLLLLLVAAVAAAAAAAAQKYRDGRAKARRREGDRMTEGEGDGGGREGRAREGEREREREITRDLGQHTARPACQSSLSCAFARAHAFFHFSLTRTLARFLLSRVAWLSVLLSLSLSLSRRISPYLLLSREFARHNRRTESRAKHHPLLLPLPRLVS